MPVISYFPSAGGLKKLLKSGDVIVLNPVFYSQSFYSNNNLTVLGNTNTFFRNTSYLKEVHFPECIIIENSAFCGDSGLTIISFPKCTTIKYSAFGDCYVLSNISLPQCVSIDSGAFLFNFTSSRSYFRNFYLPECTVVGSSAFKNNLISNFYAPKLSVISSFAFQACSFSFSSNTYTFPACTSLGSSAFCKAQFNCNISFPNCTSVAQHVFQSITAKNVFLGKVTSISSAFVDANIDTVSMPLLTTIDEAAFHGATMSYIILENCTTILGRTISSYTQYGAFENCQNLTMVSFPKLISFSGTYCSAFKNCKKLMSVYLMNSVVCSLDTQTTIAFSNTPILNSTYTGSFGSIYVPSSLLTAYQTAIRWSKISSRFVGI